MKYPLILLILVSTWCVTLAQTGNPAIITDLYQRASQFYEEDKLAECLTLLEKAEQLSSAPDAKVLYLKIKSLHALSQKEEKFKSALLQSVPVFLEVAQDQTYPSSKIQEVLAIKQSLETIQQAERAQKEVAFQNAIQQIEEQMVFVEGGDYKMGISQADAKAVYKRKFDNSSAPRHKVAISGFYIGKYKITQSQWEAIMGSNPSFHQGCPNCPLENVSWNETRIFIEKLNQLTGKKYRLPTEAEWEYIAWGGRKGKEQVHTLTEQICCIGYGKTGTKSEPKALPVQISLTLEDPHYGTSTQEVGKMKPGSVGVYDLMGNVYEWCQDAFTPDFYSSSATTNPVNNAEGGNKVYRGSSYASGLYVEADLATSENVLAPQKETFKLFVYPYVRYHQQPNHKDKEIGFRICRD